MEAVAAISLASMAFSLMYFVGRSILIDLRDEKERKQYLDKQAEDICEILKSENIVLQFPSGEKGPMQ